MRWMIPSFYGDVTVERIDAKTCCLVVHEATTQEQAVLEKFRTTAIKKGWLLKDTRIYSDRITVKTRIDAPTELVAKMLAKALKPTRRVVSAVKFRDGTIEEIAESRFDTLEGALSDARAGDLSLAPETVHSSKSEPKKEAALATSVAEPVRGCPPPVFDPIRLRAWEVLTAFLTPEQKEDFIKHDRFITIGAMTGHRYMLTSRCSDNGLALFHRSLYDLDEKFAYCVHDWDVPPEEELHTLNILLQLPGRESFLRYVDTRVGPDQYPWRRRTALERSARMAEARTESPAEASLRRLLEGRKRAQDARGRP